jgi:hypothetical protein
MGKSTGEKRLCLYYLRRWGPQQPYERNVRSGGPIAETGQSPSVKSFGHFAVGYSLPRPRA